MYSCAHIYVDTCSHLQKVLRRKIKKTSKNEIILFKMAAINKHHLLAALRYDLLIYCLLSDIILYFLLVAATSLRAGFQVYLSYLWVLRCYQSSAIRFVDTFCLISLSGFIPGNVGRMDAIVRCGRCLAGGRGCLLKGPHLIPSLKFRLPYLINVHQSINPFLLKSRGMKYCPSDKTPIY